MFMSVSVMLVLTTALASRQILASVLSGPMALVRSLPD